ncbi:Nucleotide-binding domain-containing protein [Mycena venus]|uniref:Nucleotide-binding domain-containing protein n=1 Tax=Mycena venus TaxID=2733690 RepID=A0A8H7CK19_9AGAR|nr:Nucleotide-binding domain-containing protein [Mycena venus]
MGSLFSRIRLIYQTLKSISDSFSILSERISRDPGLPGPNPSRSYWCRPPSSLDARPSTPFPEHADVLIIGSGIAGTAIARTLLDSQSHSNTDKVPPLRVVILEARDVCSGATGRNGGHISPNTYQDYSELAARYGSSAAQAIIRFRLAHLPALLAVAEEEHLSESQARVVEQFDAYLHEKLYRRAKDALERYLTALPERRGKHTVHEDTSTLKLPPLHSYTLHKYHSRGQRIQLRYRNTQRDAAGHPRRTRDERMGRAPPPGHAPQNRAYPRTHDHAAPGARARAVAPGGGRAFVLYPGTSMFAFDYLTQLPLGDSMSDVTGSKESNIRKANAAYPPPAGELMFGGGAMLGGRAEAAMMDNIGVADDSETDFEVTAYLGGALERYFEPGWGEEGSGSATGSATASTMNEDKADANQEHEWGAGRMKAAWSGILGLSADGQPWIGRVPRGVSGREEPSKVVNDNLSLASPGEWIAAGFTGEGMTHAWLSGVALARMVLGETNVAPSDGPTSDAAALPPQFLITETRWKDADIESFLGDVGFE